MASVIMDIMEKSIDEMLYSQTGKINLGFPLGEPCRNPILIVVANKDRRKVTKLFRNLFQISILIHFKGGRRTIFFVKQYKLPCPV